MDRFRLPAAIFAAAAAIIFTQPLVYAQVEPDEEPGLEDPQDALEWDTTLARGKTRTIDFETSEGTFMSADVSPDGKWIVFDLLASIYRMPIAGGRAENLTENSGVAVNYHPQYSPDGKYIAFISDRKGQNNLWVMNADGSNPVQIWQDLDARYRAPAWSADSQYIYVRRNTLWKPGSKPEEGIWMFHRKGGKGVEIIGADQPGAMWPSPSADGDYLYFEVVTGEKSWSGRGDALAGEMQVRRLDLRTGEIREESQGVLAQQRRWSSGGMAAPEISPDGRFMTFIRRIPDGRIEFKGHEFGPRTALWLRDLQSGAERILMDPVEQDLVEGSKGLRVFPGYSFTPDGRSVVVAQGGKLHKVDVASGKVSPIPFTARVKRTISEQAYREFRISDAPFEAKFIRWAAASPDGRNLAFQAVGKIWVQSLPNGTPKRLTNLGGEIHEYGPAWSPDGRSIAFVTWEGVNRGNLWTVSASGGSPAKLTREAGEYANPDWSADGRMIAVGKGANYTARQRNISNNAWWNISVFPARGGEPAIVAQIDYMKGFGDQRQQLPRPIWGPDGRIFFLRGAPKNPDAHGGDPFSELVSVTATPSIDPPRIHARFQSADEAAISPDGAQVAFLEGDNAYVAPLPYNESAGKPVTFTKDEKTGRLPAKALSTLGGLYPNWRTGRIVEFNSANVYYAYDTVTEETRETKISLTVPRDIPDGKIAFTNARIITMNGREVIEQGSLVIDGARIACVGSCDTAGAGRVIDAGGKTITPGFIDMHAHHNREYNGMMPRHSYENASYLAYGVTTTLDNSMWSQNVFPNAELVEAGMLIGPRQFSTGDPLYNRDGPRNNLLTSYEVAEQNIKRLKSWGAVSIKQYMQPRRDQRQWVSDIARKEGLMVTAEDGDLPYNLGMMMDGQTGFEHAIDIVPVYSDVAKFLGAANTYYSPTFVVAGPNAWNEEYFWQESEVWKDAKHRRWLPWRSLVTHMRRVITRPLTDYSYPLIAQGMADIIAEGGHGVIGAHGQQHALGSQWEIWMAASAMGAHGALEVATRHGASFIGVLDDLGTLEKGKLADIVVLNSNPLENIRATADIQYVMKGGVLYEADTLDQVWPKNEPFGPYYWVDEEIYRSDVRPTNYHAQ